MFETIIHAIDPNYINSVIEQRNSVSVKGVDIEAAMNRRATQFKNVKGDVVVLPLNGYISHRQTIWSAMGFETSSEVFGRWIDGLMQNPSVGAVVIDINSPGGTVMGLSAASDKIYSYRDNKKPIIAVSNGMMASAAYFIGSAADEIISDPDSLTGSIGTIAIHMDWSGAMEAAGVKPTIIKAGKYKGEGNPYQPLSDEDKASFQEQVDAYYKAFVDAVARNRGVTAATVKSDFGQGRVLNAQDAKAAGMVDRIATMEKVLASLKPKNSSKAYAQAVLDTMVD